MPQQGINIFFYISILLIMTGFGYLIIGLSMLQADFQSRLRNKYMIVCVFLAGWSLSFGLLTTFVNETAQTFLWSLGFVCSQLFFISWFDFITDLAVFRPPWIRKLTVALYCVASVFVTICLSAGQPDFFITPYGIQFNYGRSPIIIITFIYSILILLSTFFLLIRWQQSSRFTRQRKQAKIYIIITFFVMPPGLLFDFLIPAFTDSTVPPISALFVLIASIFLYITMKKNNTMDITLKNISEFLFKSITLPVLILDNENKIVLTNAPFSRFFGIEAEQLAGRKINEFIKINGGLADDSYFERDSESVLVELAQTETARICDMLVDIIDDEYGDILSKIVILNDITQLQNTIDALRASEESLLQSKNLAESASRAKSDFLSRMSHELRTPMNAIIGMSKIGMTTGDTERMQYCLSRIDDASKHLLSLINDVLDMSKIEANKLELVNESFDLYSMIDDIVNIITVKAEEKNLTLDIRIDDKLPACVIGDSLRLTQVITNLLSNAVKFTPDGGTVGLNITMISKEDDGNCFISVEVRDTGIGISEEQAARLFTSFEQADGNITRRYGGTGLGLVISKNIVEMMGGTIQIKSKPGEGSCFSFSVILGYGRKESDDNMENDVFAGDQNATYSKCRMLIAEDIEINREIVISLLEDTKIEIECAENGKEALEMFCADPYRYDIILMDMQMPEMDGLEATRRIRASGTQQGMNVPIIAMTANAFKEDIEQCRQSGMIDHIGKPVDTADMKAKLNKYLRGMQD